MSRSYLRDKYMREKVDKELDSNVYARHGHNENNRHRRDEMPKNRASKEVRLKCPNAEWLQEPSNFCGHKPHKNGHRMVSGIVRAKTKKEINEEIQNQLENGKDI